MFQKTLTINDFYFGAPDYEFPLGNIQMLGKSQGPMFREDAPKFAPGFTLDQMARHAVDFWLTSEDLPLAAQSRDREFQRRNPAPLRVHERGAESIACEGNCSRCSGTWTCTRTSSRTLRVHGKDVPIAGVAHQAGTCRFGTDPRTSVLDVNCKAHELDNLYVVDTSFFPSIGAVNPALTAMANSLRVGDHLLERLR